MPKINEKTFEKGKQLFKKRHYEAAIKKFNSIIGKNPQFELAWRYKGIALYALGNFEEANASIERALELNSSSARAWLTKMYILLHFNKYNEAINCCNEALKIHPNKYWLQMAYVHEQFKNFKEALDCIDKALAYNPNDSKAQRVKFALLNGINYGKNYYIPITRSPALDIIPPEDDIIYSTRLRMNWKVKFPRGDPKLRGGDLLGSGISYLLNVEKDKGNVIIDVLITPKGVTLFLPEIIKQEQIGLQYLPWNKVAFTTRDEMIINNVFFCNLVQEPLYESLDVFKQRYNTFHEDIRNLRYQYTKECLEKARSYIQLEQDEKVLQWVEEGFKSNVYSAEFGLSLEGDLMAIRATILKRQEVERRKAIEDIDIILINYLKANKGQTYTPQSIMKRLEGEIVNSEMLEYFQKNIEGLLNKLTFSRKIQSDLREGKMYYFF